MQKRRKKEFEDFFQFYLGALKARQLFFIYPFLSEKILSVVYHLQKKAIIAGYFRLNKNNIKVFLRYDIAKNIPLFQKVSLSSSVGRKKCLSVKKLKTFTQYYPQVFTLISTKYGILTPQQCLQLNCGGELLLTII